MILIDDLNRSI